MADTGKAWEPPTSDQEFVFKDMASAPAWIDKSWAAYDAGPALRVPIGDPLGAHTMDIVHVGDTVKWTAQSGSKMGQFTIVPGDPVKVGEGSKKPAQESGVTLEDQVKGGHADDLDETAKSQVAARTPELKEQVDRDPKTAPKKR